ncbi:MAG: T9SS type A sorting domain-containing protein [Taibaiella sp.]|nr:T9SS type A sorting domain-containing protein [Taibaiella sp.]
MRKAILLFCIFLAVLLFNSHCIGQGIITTIAGNSISQYIGDGYPATNYSLFKPTGICVDKQKNIFIANYGDNRIKRLDRYDTLFTVGGNGNPGYTGDGGDVAEAQFDKPIGVCLDTAGNLYITEFYNNVVRKVTASTNIITTVCGNGSGGYAGDWVSALTAHLETPRGACVDKQGNIYIADWGNNRIRKVNSADGIIHTVAGNGISGYSGDGGQATAAMISYPHAVCLDTAGNLIIADFGNNVIRKVNLVSGLITTIAGTGAAGYAGDGGSATTAELHSPVNLAADNKGNIFVADYDNNVVREITAGGFIFTVAGSGGYGYTGDGGPAALATFYGPAAVCVDDAGYLYIADAGNSAIRKVTPGTNGLADPENVAPFTLYPNPNMGIFSINLSHDTHEGSVQVISCTGQLIYSAALTQPKNGVDLSAFPDGLYLVKVVTGRGSSINKVLIKR